MNAQELDTEAMGGAVGIACAMTNGPEFEVYPEALLAVLLTGSSLVNGARMRARALRAGTALPETDALGWTAPDVEASPLWDLTVSIGSFRVPNAKITSLTIDLDDHCGYESCSLSFASKRANKWGSRLPIIVEYDGWHLFEGRLKTQRRSIGTELGWSLEFVGRFNQLRDHRGFRRVYADSDLENWGLDQAGGSWGGGGD